MTDRGRFAREVGRANDRRARCAPRCARPGLVDRIEVFLGGAGVGDVADSLHSPGPRRGGRSDLDSTVAFDLVVFLSLRPYLAVCRLAYCRKVEAVLSVGFFSLFTVGLARPPAFWFLVAALGPPWKFALLRANLVFSFSCDFYTLTCWIAEIPHESGGLPKNLVSTFLCFSYSLFLDSGCMYKTHVIARGKFIFSAVSTNFPLPICLSDHRPPRIASPRERMSPKILIAEKELKWISHTRGEISFRIFDL